MFSRASILAAWISIAGGLSAEQSVARLRNEQCLDAIRRDFPAPTVLTKTLAADISRSGTTARFYRVVRVEDTLPPPNFEH